MGNNTLYLITGQSGTGKDYLCDKIIKMSNGRYSKVISATTRKPRYEGEDTHRFVTEDQVLKEKKNIVAYTFQNGIHYYTTMKDIKPNSLYIIDPPGVSYIKNMEEKIKKETDIDRIVVIYLYVPVFKRLYNMKFRRKDSLLETFKRFKNDIRLYRGIWSNDYVDHIFRPLELVSFMNKNQ